MYHVHFQHHVHIHKIGKSATVRLYTTHLGSSEKHILRPLLFKESLHFGLTRQVKLGMSARYYIALALPVQLADYRRPNHSSVSGNIYLRFFLHNLIWIYP